MGQLIITPSYRDLSNGSAWSSLGASQAPAKAAVQQVCDYIRAATRTVSADVHATVTVGLNAVAATSGDPFGIAVPSGGESVPYASPVTKSYNEYLRILSRLTNISTLQRSAWNSLPGSPPTVNGSTWNSVFFSSLVMGMFDPTDPSFFDNSVMGGVGLSNQAGLNQYGLDAGGSFFELALHEITEAILNRHASFTSTTSVEPLDLYTYSSVGVRSVESAVTRYLSFDGGVTNIANLNTAGGSSDSYDFGGLPNNAFNAFGPNGPVSRDTNIPGQPSNWQATALYVPMSPTGNSWGGMTAVATDKVLARMSM